jgi:hypothetical protein
MSKELVASGFCQGRMARFKRLAERCKKVTKYQLDTSACHMLMEGSPLANDKIKVRSALPALEQRY